MLAPAKINLDLLITGKRDDGYHLLDSIVCFADVGDELFVEKSDKLSLEISGAFANGLSIGDDNLVLKAAQLICKECGVEPTLKFHLIKNLPIASGIGGGSADAAAA
ncbi:MAG: 4-(cytidine 5'-diphospho)-2-C-methyl-D-erythritol kinase, partial [Emcibacteraceae bacterium]|nr:4-(cytidine 5'-diphospho)-2-C-methyl-D-erythritol kinase [Emcibacteraceae bacterium]